MSDLHFTDEEIELVEAMARDRRGVESRLGYYAAVLAPVLLFGAYGVFRQDSLATALALLGLVIFVCWNWSQEAKYVELYRSIFRKVAQHQRGAGGSETSVEMRDIVESHVRRGPGAQ